nr:hypothetical protein OADCBASZ_OADCBASZ_CDS_0005 [Microvirus sp.]
MPPQINALRNLKRGLGNSPDSASATWKVSLRL